ncbi:condensin complex subunit [Trifolium repens]|nr:condensin complex subunit [Trifolium repens]
MNFPSCQTFVAELGSNDVDPNFSSYPHEKESFPSQDPEMDEIFGNVDENLFASLGFRSKKNAWAGPDHWQYRKAKESEVHCSSEDGSTLKIRRPRTTRQIEVDIECLGRRTRKFSASDADESTEQWNNNEPFNSWDNGSVCDGEYDGAHSDMDDSSTLISQPRQMGLCHY